METGENKNLVRRFYQGAIRERDAGTCERLLSVDLVHNGEARGRGGQRRAVEYSLAAFRDLGHRIEQILAEGDLVAAHQRGVGTHEGEFPGVGGTGRRVEFISTAVLRGRDGLIVQAWDETDSGATLSQPVA